MIVELKIGSQLVLTECCWTPGAYIAVGNPGGTQGVVIDPHELDIVIAGLTHIRASIAEPKPPKQEAA